MLRDKETSKQTGMLPVASPTKCRKSCGSVPEADILQKDYHNNRIRNPDAKKNAPGFLLYGKNEGASFVW